ncbi:MAG TPA: hypothetical protein VKA67_08505, partial [Verrucomicrobiae bacterium]|nr:hypothetical protein [Verrucomicrobiae bacterium]
MTINTLKLLRVLRQLPQFLLIGCAMLLSDWVALPWYAIAGIGLIGVSLLSVELLPARQRKTLWNWQVSSDLVATVAVLACLLLGKHAWEPYYAWLAWMLAGAILLMDQRFYSTAARAWWRMLGLVLVFSGDVIWLAVAYSLNRRIAFYSGLLLGVILLTLVKRWFRLPFVGIQVVNTLILLLVGFPLADLFMAPADFFSATPTLADRAYSYEVSRNDPAEAVRWWNRVSVETKKLRDNIFIYEPGHVPDFRLRPNSQGTFFQSRITINSNGFRGPEIPIAKGNIYRIVALGES